MVELLGELLQQLEAADAPSYPDANFVERVSDHADASGRNSLLSMPGEV
jgi:hypothetical protein